MNLTWIAAALRPRDVAPHPNFGEKGGGDPARYLAAITLGEVDRLRTGASGEPDLYLVPDPAIGLVANTLRADTLESALYVLVDRLHERRPDDLARDAALTLFACCAAAELDDYTTALRLLDYEIGFSDKPRNDDQRLIQIVLRLQRALRLRDAGEPFAHDVVRALELLKVLSVERCTPFVTTHGISWTSLETLAHIKDALEASASHLVPVEGPDPDARSSPLVPSWQDRVRARPSEQVFRITALSNEVYSEYVAQAYERRLHGAASWTLGGPARPDLFYSSLMFELLAHPRVYPARRELAQLRFLQAASPSERLELSEGLRLLRHAGAHKELDRALRWLRAGGPLGALSRDARQIVRMRLSRPLLRIAEMKVLEGAAEMLTPGESSRALDAVLASLREGGPPPAPAGWASDLVRLEPAWLAAAALGRQSRRDEEVIDLLLGALPPGSDSGDELRDRAIARALQDVEWRNLSPEPTQRAADWLRRCGTAWPISASVVSSRLGIEEPSTHDSQLGEIAYKIDATVQGRALESDWIHLAVETLRRKIREVRDAAAQGRHAFGGYTVADVASGLLIYLDQEELWPDVVGLLLDPQVTREDKTGALERLARDLHTLPSFVGEALRGGAASLMSTAVQPFGAGITPYPSAVRALSVHGLLPPDTVFGLLATFAGSAVPAERREAARTLALLVRPDRHESWMDYLSLQLSFDDDVDVRAWAGRALAVVSSSNKAAEVRIIALLQEDGLLVPFQLLRTMKDLASQLPVSIQQEVSRLGNDHPSSGVRSAAAELLLG
ncbi:MAG TPA: hypothetical protein VHD81_03960 [Mycobacteriales bacterium]|nr:hypothetical protein [Mycobacteriales bacterium]